MRCSIKNPLMLEFREERWKDLVGGYRARYDPRRSLTLLVSGRAVEQVTFGLMCCIEIERRQDDNPEIPDSC